MSSLVKTMLFGSGNRPNAKRIFGAIFVVLLIISGLFSLLTKFTLISDNEADFYRISVVSAQSGPATIAGQSMRQGVQLYIDQLNQSGGINGTKMAMDVVEETSGNVSADIEAIGNDDKTIAAIGHWSADTLTQTSKAYQKNHVPLITLASMGAGVLDQNKWMFDPLYSSSREARFLANYARNVLAHKLTSIVYDRSGTGQDMADNYEKTYRRFGSAVRYKWAFDSSSPEKLTQLNTIVKTLKEKKDAGIVFLAVGSAEAAYLVKEFRNAKIKNILIGTNKMASEVFASALQTLLGPDVLSEKYTNGIIVSTPLLFDTANEMAQNFKTSYQAKFKKQPDWLAAYAYDAAHMVTEGLRENLKKDVLFANSRTLREGVRDYLASRSSMDTSVEGLSGSTYFDKDGRGKKPVLVGNYNGKNIISALTQLNPIKPGGGRNLIAELKKGKVLYVNDRFMYKTNVVYTGIQMNEIATIDSATNSVALDFLIWFRYRGNFQPQDITFSNALEPIKLETPVEEKLVGKMTYRLYHVKGKFAMNFTNTNRQYGSQIAGISFNHNSLSRNNLLYVVDVLGIGLNAGKTVLSTLHETQALNPNLGWIMDRAWLSQDLSEKGTKGDPAYVGYGADEPSFSKVDFGTLLIPAEFNVRDFIAQEFFIYIGIFGFLGTLMAVLMDQKNKGRFWELQSWTMRVMSWPLLLLASGNIAIDFSFNNLPVNYIDMIILGYQSLWWLMVARLIGIALERFLWVPLEDHTERNIPNVIRVFASVSVYSFAFFGIIAFVYNQQLTSLLASTGLMAMIIGLAVQSNIANIFSGIVINLESPFHVGDWVQIGDNDEGKVIDITWRTTRVRTRAGYVISIPNGQVAESNIHNFNSFDCVRVELDVYVEAHYNPEICAKVLERALNKVDGLLDQPGREVRYKGVTWEFGWISNFELQFWIDDYALKEDLKETVLEVTHAALKESGIITTVGAPEKEIQIAELKA